MRAVLLRRYVTPAAHTSCRSIGARRITSAIPNRGSGLRSMPVRSATGSASSSTRDSVVIPAGVRSTMVASSTIPIRTTASLARKRQIFMALSKELHEHGLAHRTGYGDRISQRPAEAGELNGHYITFREQHVIREAETMGTKIMHVDVTATPMRLELEVMVLDIRDTVTHLTLACRDLALPQNVAGPLDRHAAGRSEEHTSEL